MLERKEDQRELPTDNIDNGGVDRMAGLKQISCKPENGKLVCKFKVDGETPIQVAASVNDKGEAVIVDSFAGKDGVDPKVMLQAEQLTLEKIKLKRQADGEF